MSLCGPTDSRMALIQLLLPLLRKSESPRVLSVLSGGVHSSLDSKIWKSDPELKTSFTLKNAADAAGFYNDLALDHFARDPANKNIEFVHSAPGFVSTGWGKDMPWYVRGLLAPLKMLAMKKEDAAEYLCVPLLSPDLQTKKGLVIMGVKATNATVTGGHTDEAREAIWKHTVEVFARGGISA